MATRSRSTFQKRQKEMKRQEKQRMKADRRAQRNLAKRAENEARSDIATPSAELDPQIDGSGFSEADPAAESSALPGPSTDR